MSNLNAHKPPEIITRLARQISHILTDYLTRSELINQRHPLRDRFAVKLMLTLSQVELYRQELLFRDFGQTTEEQWVDFILPNGTVQKLHTESIFYVQAVMGKRLQPVAKRKSKPTNLHILFMMLCRMSVDSHWRNTWIKRKRESAEGTHEAFFEKVAKVLKRQCRQLKNFSTLALNNRERYGLLNLIAGQNRTELADEICLFDVIEALPIPLNLSMQQPPVWYPALIERILLSLNESYGLLRSCGLPPQEFWDELSIGKLRELRNFRKLAEQHLKNGLKKNLYDAYKLAFEELSNAESNKNNQTHTSN